MKLRQYLLECRELNAFCTQNGWIDNDTLQVDIVERDGLNVIAAVTFEEILMEGAGCVAGRVPCHGRVHVRLSEEGDVEALDPL